MHPFEAAPATSHYTARIYPALAGEACGTLARLIAYLCTLALIAMLGIFVWISTARRGTGIGHQNRVGAGLAFGPGIRREICLIEQVLILSFGIPKAAARAFSQNWPDCLPMPTCGAATMPLHRRRRFRPIG